MKNTKYTRKWFSPKSLKKMAYGYVNGTKIPADVPESVQKKVIEIAKAIKFVDDYSKENKIVTERLRTYFVGETIKCNAGFEVWAPCRGKPTGTVVAIKTDWGIAVGISKIAKDENSANKGIVINNDENEEIAKISKITSNLLSDITSNGKVLKKEKSLCFFL